MIFIALLIVLIFICVCILWVYGWFIHKTELERDAWEDKWSSDRKIWAGQKAALQNQLNEIPRSIREHYSKK